MTKRPLFLLAAGVLMLAAGGYLKLTGGPPAANAALSEQCRQTVAGRGGDHGLMARCDEAAFASAMTATDAQDAAMNISALNRSELVGNMPAMFLIGVGLLLTFAGAAGTFRRL